MQEKWFDQILGADYDDTEEPVEQQENTGITHKYAFGIPAPWKTTELEKKIANLLTAQNRRAWITDGGSIHGEHAVSIIEPLAGQDSVPELAHLEGGIIIPIDFLPKSYLRHGMSSHLIAPDLAWIGPGEEGVADAFPIEIQQARKQQKKNCTNLLEYKVSGVKLRTLMERNPLLNHALHEALDDLGCDDVLFRDGVLITDEKASPDKNFGKFVRDAGAVRRARILEFGIDGARVTSILKKEGGESYRLVGEEGVELHLFPYTHNAFTTERRQFFNQPNSRRVIPPARAQVIHRFTTNGRPIFSLDYFPDTGISFYDDLRIDGEYNTLMALESFCATEKLMTSISKTLKTQLVETNARLEKLRRQLGDLKDDYRSWKISYVAQHAELDTSLAETLGPSTLVHTWARLRNRKAPEPNKALLVKQRKALESLDRNWRGMKSIPSEETLENLLTQVIKNKGSVAEEDAGWYRELERYINHHNPEKIAEHMTNTVTRNRLLKSCRRYLTKVAHATETTLQGWIFARRRKTSDAARAYGYQMVARSDLLPSFSGNAFSVEYGTKQLEQLQKFAEKIVANIEKHKGQLTTVAESNGSTDSFSRLPGWLRQYSTYCMEFLGTPHSNGDLHPRFYLANRQNARLVSDRLEQEATAISEGCDSYLKNMQRLEFDDLEKEKKIENLSEGYERSRGEAKEDKDRLERIARLQETALTFHPVPMNRVIEAYPEVTKIEEIRKELVEELKRKIKRREYNIAKRISSFEKPFENILRGFDHQAVNNQVGVFYLDLSKEMYGKVVYKAVLVPTIRI